MPRSSLNSPLTPSRSELSSASREHLLELIKGWGKALGFSEIGVASVDLSHAERGLLDWLGAGFHGEMQYMSSHGLKRARPAELVPGTLSVITARMNYLPRSTNTQQAQLTATMPDLSAGYHNYWVTHLPNQITFGVDNITLGTLTPASLAPGSQWVYNQPMYAILDLAVGGSWAGAPTSSTPSTAQMLVDSITWTPPS